VIRLLENDESCRRSLLRPARKMADAGRSPPEGIASVVVRAHDRATIKTATIRRAVRGYPMSDVSTSERQDAQAPIKEGLERERYELLQRLDDWLDTPMLLLSLLWLALLVVELIRGDVPAFEMIVTIIWIIFVIDFALEFVLAPHKVVYLKSNWLMAVSIMIPALRIFRVFRVFRLLRLARAGRGLSFLRLVSSLNRGMRALGASLSRRGFGYVLALTLLVVSAGAAGMYSFENGVPGGLNSYGEALWWTAMVMTTLGSQYWPQTAEGRVLCVFLALYAVAVFSYVTAALATFFVGRDAENDEAELAGAKELAILREEVIALRDDIRALSRRPPEL
jgi:voltage-gated potassium channel